MNKARGITPVALAGFLAMLPVERVFAFSTHDVSRHRAFDQTTAPTSSHVTVTCTLTNHEPEDLRGLFWTEHVPSSLTVSNVSVRLNGDAISNYLFETGNDGDVYTNCTPYRWILEQPTGFTESNAVASNAWVEIVYKVSSATQGVFNLNEFSWAGYYKDTQDAAFGFSEPGDAQSVCFFDACNVAAGHACDGYRPVLTGSTVNCQFGYPTNGTLLSLVWQLSLPAGWQLATVAGDGSPTNNGSEILFTGTFATNPLSFSYTVDVPVGAIGVTQIAAQAQYRLGGMLNSTSTAAMPDPLVIRSLHDIVVNSVYGTAIPGTTNVPYGTVLDESITPYVVTTAVGRVRVRVSDVKVDGNDAVIISERKGQVSWNEY